MVHDKAVRFTLRVVPVLNRQLEMISKDQGVSKNSLIVNTLWRHIKETKVGGD